MTAAVMGSVAWLVSLAACAWAVQWLCRAERRELKADHDSELAAMATRHKAAVRSMEEAHQEEVKYWETTVSEIRERSEGHARRAAAMEEAVRQAWASGRVIGDALANAMKQAGEVSDE